jgi:hypothetical protein
MKERPILFSGPMVRAILDGSKTQTRRVVKDAQLAGIGRCHWSKTGWAHLRLSGGCSCQPVRCPYGTPGDRLWVRETWQHNIGNGPPIIYRADHGAAQSVYEADLATGAWKVAVSGWRPSIHMPRAASRILLEITDVRVQRLQEISDEDARAEGIEYSDDYAVREHAHVGLDEGDLIPNAPPMPSFRSLWERIHGPGSWHANPWVWAITFWRIQP